MPVVPKADIPTQEIHIPGVNLIDTVYSGVLAIIQSKQTTIPSRYINNPGLKSHNIEIFCLVSIAVYIVEHTVDVIAKKDSQISYIYIANLF